jgi:hypothetical protein
LIDAPIGGNCGAAAAGVVKAAYLFIAEKAGIAEPLGVLGLSMVEARDG